MRAWTTALKIAALLALLYGANHLTHQISDALEFELRPSNEDVLFRVITVSALLYTVLLAIPYVPGAEIGIAMMMALGPPIAFLVYLCTVAGLMCSFVIGRMVPINVLKQFADRLNLSRLSRLLNEIEPLNREERVEYLAKTAPKKFYETSLRYRYLGLAVLLNLPGNFLIGGGGGIGLVCGMSGLFSPAGYLAAVMIAVSPIPLAVSIFGKGFFE